jgi:hypothetical protein
MWFEASIAKKEEVRRKAWQRERERAHTSPTGCMQIGFRTTRDKRNGRPFIHVWHLRSIAGAVTIKL